MTVDKSMAVKSNNKIEKQSVPEIEDGIEFHKGHTNILLIAPHGVETSPRDDIGTAELTRQIQAQLGCSAIINTKYRKPEGNEPKKRNNGNPRVEAKVLNLNLVAQAKQLPDFINKIKEVVNSPGVTYVFWIHGIADENIAEGLDCYVGYGQPNIGQDSRYTADGFTVSNLMTTFNKNLIIAYSAPKDSGYRGWSQRYMNQWFQLNNYSLTQVQSIQLEFKFSSIRKKEKIESSAQKIAIAIPALIKPVTEIEEAYNHIKRIFVKHFQNAMLEVGQYLIDKMYGSYESAIKKEPKGKKSLSKLAKRIQQDSQEKGNAPSRTWIYDAVNLAIDNHLYEQKALPSVYGQLGHSHKVNLTYFKYTPQKDDDKKKRDENRKKYLKIKKALVEEAVDKKHTVARFRERIREEKHKQDDSYIPIKEVMPLERLMEFTPEQLEKIKAKTIVMEAKVKETLNLYKGNLELILQALARKK